MPVPKRQQSHSRSNKRSAGKHKIPAFAANCSNCEALVIQHAVCEGCGFYKGVKVLRPKSERALERKVAKQVRERSLQVADAQRRLAAEQSAKSAAQAEKTEENKKNVK